MPRGKEPASFARLFALCGGLLFAGSLVYLGVSYAGRFGVDAGAWSFSGGWRPALLDSALFTAFAAHHSMFARSGLKVWIHGLAPPALERSIYVWIASLLLVATCVFWLPVPGGVWSFAGPARAVLLGVQVAGVALTLVSSHRLDNLSLAGVRQVFSPPDGRAPSRLYDAGPFGLVRHPIYLGWFLMVWPTPVMTGTRLVFAVVSCAYLVLAIPFEERDLRKTFGAAYDVYARNVRWRVIPFVY